MGTIRNLMLAGVCASLSSLAAAQVYKWVDERGVTHYGQRPPSTQSGARVLREPAPPAVAAPATDAAPTSVGSRPATPVPGSNAAAFATCRSRACNSVRRVDPDCRSSQCTEALALPDECSTISCQSRRSDLDKRVRKQLSVAEARARPKSKNSDIVTRQRAAFAEKSKAKAIARCKESRGINCDDPGIAAQWARQDQPITDQERNQAINARRHREACAGVRGALGC